MVVSLDFKAKVFLIMKFIMAYVELRDSRISKVCLLDN